MPAGGQTGTIGAGGDQIPVDVADFPDDSEPVVLCDSGNADKPFLRRYLYDDLGILVNKLDTELDGSTAYVVTAEANVTDCFGGGGGSGSGLPTVVPCAMHNSVDQTQALYGFEDRGASGAYVQINPGTGGFTTLLATAYDDVNCVAYLPDRHALIGRETASGDFHLIDLATLTDTNLGTAPGLPAGTWIYGSWDPRSCSYYIGASGGTIWSIEFDDTQILAASQAFNGTLVAGSGDFCFDRCGTAYVIIDGVLVRFDSVADASPVLIATVPDNGSGFGGGAACQEGVLISHFEDGEIFVVGLETGEIITGLGPLASADDQLDWAWHPEAKSCRAFKRVYEVNAAGAITGTFSDIDTEGDPFTIVGTEEIIGFGECPECCCDDGPRLDTTAVVTTLVPSGGSFTTSPLARRVQSQHESQPAAGRDTINGTPIADVGGSGNIFSWGDLSTGTRVPPITFTTAGGRDVFVTEEI